MRLKITLSANQQTIPINYQHFLTSAIYNYLSIGDIKFSANLHDSTNFKFYTFSWLQFPQKKIIDSTVKIVSPEFHWYISSPWNEFVQNFVSGLLELGGLHLGEYKFPVVQAETLPNLIERNVYGDLNSAKDFKFSCLSPLVITTKKEYKGKLVKYYYKSNDLQEEISEKIRQNLINKYSTFYKKTTEEIDDQTTKLKIEFDQNYIKTPKSQVLSHYIKSTNNVIAGETKQSRSLDIKIPAIMCPFTATGSLELIKFGYECGFGELNSAGFGMVRMV